MPPRRRAVVFAAIAVVVMAAASRRAGAQIKIAEPPGRRCVPVETPAQFPALVHVIDLPGLRNSVGKLPAGSAIFAASFNTSGFAELPVAVSSSFTADLTESMATALMNAMRDQPAGAWTLLVRIESAAPLRIEIDRSTYCHAALADGVPEIDAWLNARVVGAKRLNAWQLTVEVQLDSVGHAISAKVLGPPPYPSLDGIDAAVARNTIFYAPWQDGRYVARVDTLTFGKGPLPPAPRTP
ncbi:MAG: hypothetical protein ABJD07_10870 [Gemmatimonadaceae bacterium]